MIKKIHARQVFDSRGNPTVEVEICTENCFYATAIVPSGASTGEREAAELRDNDKNNYMGKSVFKAIKNVNEIIGPAIIKEKFCPTEQAKIDNFMIKLDGTPFKTKLGANAILGVSMAMAKLGAKISHQPLYRYLGGANAKILPTPMLNILNGGAHADNTIDFQEFMIVPIGSKNFPEAIKYASEIYHHLKNILKANNHSTLIGDEGGFAPNCKKVTDVLDLLIDAITQAGYEPALSGEKAVAIALDIAASEFFQKKGKYAGKYYFKKISKGKKNPLVKTTKEMISFYKKIIKKYPIISIEDPFDENDWKGFRMLTKELKGKIQIVGDDLYVTNTKFIKKGIQEKATNSVLIKLNQIGTVTETIDAIQLAQKNNWTAIISHRSGETEDTFIADLAVGLNTGQIKTGSMARTDRIAKYNQLLRINEELQENAIYSGEHSFYNLKIETK